MLGRFISTVLRIRRSRPFELFGNLIGVCNHGLRLAKRSLLIKVGLSKSDDHFSVLPLFCLPFLGLSYQFENP